MSRGFRHTPILNSSFLISCIFFGNSSILVNDIEEDNDIVHGDNKDGEWKEGQTETYGEAANIRKIFELFRFKKEEEIEDHTEAKNSIVIGFSMNVGMKNWPTIPLQGRKSLMVASAYTLT